VLIKLREAGAMATHGLDQALRVLEGWGLLRAIVMSFSVAPGAATLAQPSASLAGHWKKGDSNE
jgi:hypothetical protein